MRFRNLAPFALALTVACGEAATDDTATAEETQDYAAETAADATAAMAELSEYWQTHFNAGHGSMVADKYVDTGLWWTGTGSMVYGKEALGAAFQTQIDAIGSQVQIHPAEVLTFGDFALTRGHFVMNSTVDGAEVTNSGYYTTLAENFDGQWLLHGGVTNLESPDQTVTPGEAMEAPEGENAELLQELADYHVTHFNQGHASMVADRYTEDAVVMFSGQGVQTGRAAALAQLEGMTAAGVTFNHVTPWSARELDENHITGVGTFSLQTPDGEVTGHFAALYERNADGQLMTRWLLTAEHPAAM